MKTGGRRLGAMLLAGAALIAALLLVSGEERADPQTPPALPGLPPPFLGTTVLGDGGLTAAVDAYGNVVDLRAGPAGEPLIENSAERQAAGTVPSGTGIVPQVRIDGSDPIPLWRAGALTQRYLPGTNVVLTVAWVRNVKVTVRAAARAGRLAIQMRAWPPLGERTAVSGFRTDLDDSVRCREGADPEGVGMVCGVEGTRLPWGPNELIAAASRADRRWLQRARPLGPGAPRWAERMQERSLLVMRALTDRRNGAVAAGAREGWAYVWPRDAGAVAIALAAAGYRPEAELIARFLLGLDLEGTARFHGDGSPVPGRHAQGDEIGWVAAAARAAGTIGSARHAARILSEAYPVPWRERADYWEGEPGDYLANAIASGEPAERIEAEFGTADGLAREAGGRGGIDSAAAWAVQPFTRPSLFDPVRRTLLRLDLESDRYGVLPGAGWPGGEDPWSAPAAWSAWALATLARREPDPTRAHGNRRVALGNLGRLNNAATAMGTIPERVDADTGIPRSTTPLAWSHAFAVLALRELWPSR